MTCSRARAAIAVLLALSCRRHEPADDIPSLDDLLAAAPALRRSTEARIQGLAWVPAADGNNRKGSSSAAELELQGKIGRIFLQQRSTPEKTHLAGVASLLLGSGNNALALLEEAARARSSEPRFWNDLAAARYAVAVGSGDPSRLPAALAAADRALQLAPSLAAARFNRALILTRIGLRNEAAREWHAALTAEREPAWSAETRRRLQAVEAHPAPPLSAELQAALRRAREGDSRPLHDIVRRRIEELRTTGETVMITQWAEAAHGGETARAASLLGDLHRIASALAAANGDRLLGDIVACIDATPAPQLQALVAAHLAYRDARLHYRDHLDGSDAKLWRSASLLAVAGSPLRYAARYYAANATFDRGHPEEARTALEGLLGEIDSSRYPSLAAGVSKQLGLYYGFRGMWTASLLHLDRARHRFDTIGEHVNAAFAEAIVGEVNDRIGQFGTGWRHRSNALQVLSRSAPSSLSLAVLVGAVHAEILRGDYESALSLLSVAREEADRVGDTVLTAEMLIRRARVLLAARGSGEAQRSLMAARHAVSRIADVPTRRRLVADIEMVAGQSMRDSDPCRAIAILTPSIELYETSRVGMLLPGAYLERGRAWLGCGDAGAALDDFRRGLAEVERQRATIAMDVRTTMFDTVPDLIAETVELLLAHGRDEEAYVVVERARARTLIEALDVPHPAAADVDVERIAAALPGDGVLIEYALLPRGVAAFCISRRGMTAVRLNATPGELRQLVDRLATAIDSREPIERVVQLAGTLHARLLAPLEPAIGSAGVLYIVPDRFLYAVPFPALFDRGRRQYLIERHRVVIAPSGAFLLRRRAQSESTASVLIVSDPRGAESSTWLRAARREAAAIRRLYPGAKRIEGPAATIGAFIAAARTSSLIHYAGHGSDDDGGGFLSLAPSAGNDGRLDATAIARLSLPKTRMVILSACATMRGTSSRVEGMPSVSRGFLTAGVPLVLGMLWEVEDESASRLLRSFHERLREHRVPSAALQETQRRFLRSDDEAVRHPASWAAAAFMGVD